EALEYSGKLLSKVSSVFYGLRSANTNDGIKEISGEVGMMLSSHYDDINLNMDLFNRIEEVYNQKDELGLNQEQSMLLEDTYKGFVRSGINLPEDKKSRLREINSRLSELSNEFGQNLLAETNNFQLVIDNKQDLAGLPEGVIAGAAETASAEGMEGKWLFTTQKPSMLPFLQYAENRDLREKLYKGYFNRGDNDNEYDNKAIVAEIANLRVERAHLLGFDSYADYVLEDRMAKKSENVYNLLDELWAAALPVAKQERAAMQEVIDSEGGDFQLASWDWWYYAEKVRQQRYSLDENEIRSYFQLENVREGAFYTANQLFGLTINEIDDENFPKPHPDAQVFEVLDNDNSHLGILYMDFHPRASKKPGAWCGVYRKQHRTQTEENVAPVVTIVCNFSKPVGNTPALLSFDEASTLFHEFGHGLHQLLSDNQYKSLSGTSTPRDFVELPSQIMENWAAEPEVMNVYAKHYETDEVIPEALVEKMKNAGKFNQGFATVEYLAASLLDMEYHTLTEKQDIDVESFEKNYLDEIGLIDEIKPRYRTTYFNHIWASGYSAGYYSYIWAGVLDADAFEAFKETSLFDQETATAFREHVLSKGGTDDAMEMYKRFRGQEPSKEPLLRRRGLL
ncbi:MAG: M3 family metallopeptidase, partial [Bacteroidales bacterium]